jgi:hypothetical protein
MAILRDTYKRICDQKVLNNADLLGNQKINCIKSSFGEGNTRILLLWEDQIIYQKDSNTIRNIEPLLFEYESEIRDFLALILFSDYVFFKIIEDLNPSFIVDVLPNILYLLELMDLYVYELHGLVFFEDGDYSEASQKTFYQYLYDNFKFCLHTGKRLNGNGMFESVKKYHAFTNPEKYNEKNDLFCFLTSKNKLKQSKGKKFIYEKRVANDLIKKI